MSFDMNDPTSEVADAKPATAARSDHGCATSMRAAPGTLISSEAVSRLILPYQQIAIHD
jgi:hypothetical protein